MTKNELIAYIAEKTDLTKTKSAEVVDALQEGIVEGVKNGKVSLVGFGTFEKKERKAREGRNPRTGETVQIAAQNAVTFKPGSKFKEEINK